MSPPPKRFVKNKNGVNVLNPEYLAWKKKGGKRPAQKQREAPIEKMVFVADILQGKNLVAMDRKGLFGKKTSSDPYIKVILECLPPPAKEPVPARSKHYSTVQKINLGKTAVVKKSLDPTWNHAIKQAVGYSRVSERLRLHFQIFDEDKFSMSDDAMGTVVLPPLEWRNLDTGPVWYEVPKNSAKNASGSLQIRLRTQLVRMVGVKTYC
eukprot:jgi/Psemu1/69202/estExt_Genemark1.C_7590004